jgi:hypothetical protein
MDLNSWDLFSHVTAVWMGATVFYRPATNRQGPVLQGDGPRAHAWSCYDMRLTPPAVLVLPVWLQARTGPSYNVISRVLVIAELCSR